MISSGPLREVFEETVFGEFGAAGMPFGMAKDCPTKAELLKREGEDYADPSVSAMWFGWRAALKFVDGDLQGPRLILFLGFVAGALSRGQNIDELVASIRNKSFAVGYVEHLRGLLDDLLKRAAE